LLAPVLRDCERLGLLEIARERERLASAARSGAITAGEMAGGTFTITNLGPLRVDAFTPVVNPPQIAILGMGRIRQAAAVFQGALAVRDLVVLSLTFDHRVVDGAPAARFLDEVAALVEQPERLWLLPG
jgi:pyruvate dehydrogenase E2 component (dihydrolipoamide acetyltransferase)